MKTITRKIDRVYVEQAEVEVPITCPSCRTGFAGENECGLGEFQIDYAVQACRVHRADDIDDWGDREHYGNPLVTGYTCRHCGNTLAGDPGVHELAEGAAILRTMWGWRPIEDEGAEIGDYLHATTWILGTPFHVSAIRVIERDERLVAASDRYACTLDAAELAHEPDGSFMTTKVPGWPGDYVLLIYPHSS